MAPRVRWDRNSCRPARSATAHRPSPARKAAAHTAPAAGGSHLRRLACRWECGLRSGILCLPGNRCRVPRDGDRSSGPFVRLQNLCEELLVLTPGPWGVLRICPAYQTPRIDEYVCTVGEELVLDQRAVAAADLALEVAEQLHRQPLLSLELPQRRYRIDTDRQNYGVRIPETAIILSERAHLLSAYPGERQGKERQKDVLSPKAGECNVGSRSGWKSEVRGRRTDRG